MTELSPARKVAYEVVRTCRMRDAFAKNLIDQQAHVACLLDLDKALATRLVLGVVATRGYLEALIERYRQSGVRLRPEIKDALCVAVFELLYLNTPAAICVSQGVELVASLDQTKIAVANALLRALSEQEVPRMQELRKKAQADLESLSFAELEALSAMPGWLVKKIRKSLPDFYRSYMVHVLDPAPVYAALPPDISSDRYIDLELESTVLPYTYKVGNPRKLVELSSDEVVVADLSAQLISYLSCPEPDSLMLEIGQGRATKTMLFEQWSEAQGKPAIIIGLDSHAYKTKIAEDRLREHWGSYTFSVTYDATKLNDAYIPQCLNNEFDQVFCDVPCSGTGTLRRHPEIAWSLKPEAFDRTNPESLVSLQQAILQASASRVKEGGRLVYSTCSVLREENERQIEQFLQSEAGASFRRVSVTDVAFACELDDEAFEFVSRMESKTGALQVTSDEADSHYVCIMQRI